MADVNIRNEIKAEIAKSGWTLTDIVKEMNLERKCYPCQHYSHNIKLPL